MSIGNIFGDKPSEKPHQEPAKPETPYQGSGKPETPYQAPGKPEDKPYQEPAKECHPAPNTCKEIQQGQNHYLSEQCGHKFNYLPHTSCNPKEDCVETKGDCCCDCVELHLPDVKPCISVKWGDSACDCFETEDFEVLCISVCNCYCNVTFSDLSIGHITVTNMDGSPVPLLPDKSPSVQVVPSGPICFGDIGPCCKDKPSCVSRELVIKTCGAIGGKYRLSFSGVCFSVTHHFQTEQCFVIKLCQD